VLGNLDRVRVDKVMAGFEFNPEPIDRQLDRSASKNERELIFHPQSKADNYN
jgi:hypothetical protein